MTPGAAVDWFETRISTFQGGAEDGGLVEILNGLTRTSERT
ncbi:MAG: hypothetical protein BMS9Abin37_0736 [Acidobacteriota bacterium]|nr:MAG: hypothetical protein BMS9Abin37_0736 [Acidobacteriota bacterium]